MSIWKYFKCVPWLPSELVKRKDEGLPEPTGLLSKSVLVKAIELANAQVEKLVQLDKTRDSGRASKGKTAGLDILWWYLPRDMKLTRGQRSTSNMCEGCTGSIKFSVKDQQTIRQIPPRQSFPLYDIHFPDITKYGKIVRFINYINSAIFMCMIGIFSYICLTWL